MLQFKQSGWNGEVIWSRRCDTQTPLKLEVVFDKGCLSTVQHNYLGTPNCTLWCNNNIKSLVPILMIGYMNVCMTLPIVSAMGWCLQLKLTASTFINEQRVVQMLQVNTKAYRDQRNCMLPVGLLNYSAPKALATMQDKLWNNPGLQNNMFWNIIFYHSKLAENKIWAAWS